MSSQHFPGILNRCFLVSLFNTHIVIKKNFLYSSGAPEKFESWRVLYVMLTRLLKRIGLLCRAKQCPDTSWDSCNVGGPLGSTSMGWIRACGKNCRYLPVLCEEEKEGRSGSFALGVNSELRWPDGTWVCLAPMSSCRVTHLHGWH